MPALSLPKGRWFLGVRARSAYKLDLLSLKERSPAS